MLDPISRVEFSFCSVSSCSCIYLGGWVVILERSQSINSELLEEIIDHLVAERSDQILCTHGALTVSRFDLAVYSASEKLQDLSNVDQISTSQFSATLIHSC